MVPFLLAAILFSYFGLQRRAWQQGGSRQMSTAVATPEAVDSQGMNYLVSLPRRVVTVYLPLGAFLIVLLFPFYWMAITTFKPNEELLSREGNPFWVMNPTLAHIKKLLFDTAYPDWLWNTVLVSVVATFLSLFAACSRRMRSSGCASAARATSA